MSESNVIEINLPICHVEENSRLETEVVEVEPIGPKQYRLLFSPGLVEGVARGDVVELSDTDPKGFTVIRRSGFLCVWFYWKEAGANRGPGGNDVRACVEQFGGVFDGGGNTHLIFSVPVSFGFPVIESHFNDLVGQYPDSTWLFGNVYNPWDNFEPIGWWEQ